MKIQAFSCARPLPERMDSMCEPATAAELDALIADEAYTQDLGRSVYLVARRDGELVRRGIVCCGDVDELAALAQAAGAEAVAKATGIDAEAASNGEEATVATAGADGGDTGVEAVAAGRLRALGAHAEPIVVEHSPSFALDVIVGAAQTATPLYNLSNGTETQVVVWRVSRQDAVDAICAALAAEPGKLAGEGEALTANACAAAAAAALAAEARAKRAELDERAAVLHPLCLLVPAGQDMSIPLLPCNGLLLHRFA